MTRAGWSIVMSLATLAVASPGLAKGAADEITIRGPCLEDPVEIADPRVLDQFSPWTGRFLGEVMTEHPTVTDSQRYEVVFLLRRADGEPSIIYGFDYYPGSGHRPGYIRLPGPEERQGVTNRQTIIRSTDGRWHQATSAWAEAIADLLDTAVQPGCTELVTDLRGKRADR